jgi:hypothetical protein
MLRRISAAAALLGALAGVGGCRFSDHYSMANWNIFHTEGEDVVPESATPDDPWSSVGAVGRGTKPAAKQAKNPIASWFSSLEEPRTGQINRNLGVSD